MKKSIILLLLLFFCLLLVACDSEDADNTTDSLDQPKSLYELAIDAGFEGTLEEWCEAIANTKDVPSDETECTCQNCQNSINLADAIMIAQTHYFAVFYPNYSNSNSSMVDVAELIKEDLENWYINIAPKDVRDDDNSFVHKGQSYLYTISKETGTIIEIDSSGE